MARKGLRARARLRIAGVMEDWSVGVLNLLVSRRMKSSAPASAEARMNLPGSTEGNWRWRCTDEMLSELVFERL